MTQKKFQSHIRRLFPVGVFSCVAILAFGLDATADDGALTGVRHRVLVSTDIGGTDPDDIQSMVHLLVYADVFDLEGLISSPYGPGRKAHILDVIDAYEKDYQPLKSHSENYPRPDELRAKTKQGAIDTPGQSGIGNRTEGSDWIIECAQRQDPRPLHILVWGGLEDLAQALHDAPSILPKLRVYWIGGPNKKWSVDAYNYIEQNHPGLWMIEANATYRGWFVGGYQQEEWGNAEFVKTHIAGHGALGYVFSKAKADVKMGDTPSVARLLKGDSENPSQPSWGGRFVPIWEGRKTLFNRLTTEVDESEVFGVTEFILPKPEAFTPENKAFMIFNQGVPASQGGIEGDVLRFRFSPRDAKLWSYVIESDSPDLNGKSGKFNAAPPAVSKTKTPSTTHPNWWIDDPDPAASEGIHPGAKSVSQWRVDFLGDFAKRMDRCKPILEAEPTNSLPQPIRWGGHYLKFNPNWYSTKEAQKVAHSVIQYQSPQGGWPKNTDIANPPRSKSDIPQPDDGRANTIDNGATTLPMRFLALMTQATGENKYKEAFNRGLDYLLEAQYSNGGWPQFYPLREGYYSHITYNDGAMINVMTLLREVGAGKVPYTFVDPVRRQQAGDAVKRGIDCILKTQVRQGGKLTVWCAQHDVNSLKPAWARNYEIPSLSGSESVGIVRFLMEETHPSPEIIAAIEGAVQWFMSVQINGWSYQRGVGADGKRDAFVKPDPTAGPLWARFYDLETNRPLFTGRDKVIRYSLAEIEQERRGGYAYYSNAAESLLTRDYPRWKTEHNLIQSTQPSTNP